MAEWEIGASTETYHSTRMRFHYRATPNESTRTVKIEWYLQPDSNPKESDAEAASYYLCQGNQEFKIRVGDVFKKNWTMSATFSDNGRTVHNGYARVPGNTNTYKKEQIWFDTNGNFTGQRWWLKAYGEKFLKGEFTLNYPDSGKLSFDVYGNFAWVNSTRRKFGWKTIVLPSITSRYKITYQTNGGKNSGDSVQYKLKDKNIHLWKGTNFTRNGYKIDGWIDTSNNKKWALNSLYESNSARTFKASWDPNKYDLIFNENKPEGALGDVSGIPTGQNKVYGTDYIMPPTTKASGPALNGYEFVGWSLSANGGVDYQAGVKYTENKPLTLYAVWKANQYNIILHDYPNGVYETIQATYNEYLSNSEFITYQKEGYDLLGWSLKQQQVYQETPTTEELEKILYNGAIDISKTRFLPDPAGDVELYPVLKYSTTVYIKTSDGWKLAMPYVKTSDDWKQSLSYVKTNDGWKI